MIYQLLPIAAILLGIIYLRWKNRHRFDVLQDGRTPYLAVIMKRYRNFFTHTGFTPIIIYSDKSWTDLKECIHELLPSSQRLVALDIIKTDIDSPYWTYHRMEQENLVHYIGINPEKYKHILFEFQIDKKHKITDLAEKFLFRH